MDHQHARPRPALRVVPGEIAFQDLIALLIFDGFVLHGGVELSGKSEEKECQRGKAYVLHRNTCSYCLGRFVRLRRRFASQARRNAQVAVRAAAIKFLNEQRVAYVKQSDVGRDAVKQPRGEGEPVVARKALARIQDRLYGSLHERLSIIAKSGSRRSFSASSAGFVQCRDIAVRQKGGL